MRRWAERTPAGIDKNDRDEQRRQRELQRVGIALGEEVGDALVVAEGGAEVAVQDTFPVVEVLFAERGIESVGVAGGCDIGGRRAFAEHLLDGISGDEMDQEEDEADYQPDYWEGVEDALEEKSHQFFASIETAGPSTSHLIPFGNEMLRSG